MNVSCARCDGGDPNCTACAKPASTEHEWVFKAGFAYSVCQNCGIVRRYDGKNKPCRGKVKVVLR